MFPPCSLMLDRRPNWTGGGGGGPVAVVSAVSPSQADIAGGGGRVVVTVDNSVGATGIKIGISSFTSFAIDDPTHVSGVPGAHSAGTGLEVVVTNGGGDSTTGTGLFEYWSPAQITGVSSLYDSELGVTGSPVTAWADQSSNAHNLTTVSGQEPTYTASAFGTMHGLTFDGTKRIGTAGQHNQPAGRSVFVVAKWTSSVSTTTNYVGNVPLVLVGDQSGNVQGSFGASAGTIDYSDANSGTPQHTRGSGLNDNTARLVGVTHNSSTNVAKLYVDTTQQGSDVTMTSYDTRWGWTSIGAGYSSTNNGDGFVGTIGAVVNIDQVISGGDLTKLNNWAKQRFGTP